MTQDTDRLVRRFLDGELDSDEESRVLHRIADDEQARQLLRFDRDLRDRLSAARGPQVAPDFSSRTMAAIAAEEEAEAAERDRTPAWEWLERAWDYVARPRAVVLRPAYGLATVLLLLALVGLWPSTEDDGAVQQEGLTVQQTATADYEPARHEVVGVRFLYIADQASSVAVAGDFSGWDPVPLEAKTIDGEQVWTAVVPLPKGEHQYMFVVDGEKWVTDPLAPVQRSDGFGNRNAVISI